MGIQRVAMQRSYVPARRGGSALAFVELDQLRHQDASIDAPDSVDIAATK
jgi:hypothetical protein